MSLLERVLLAELDQIATTRRLIRAETRYRLALAREDAAAAIVRKGNAHPDAWDELAQAAIWTDAWAQAIVHYSGADPRV